MIAEPTPTKAAPSSAMLSSSSAFEAHLAAGRGYSAHTVKAYLTDVTEFLIMFAAEVTDPSEITLEHLRDWLWRLSESGLAKSSLARKSASLRAFTAWLHETGRAATDPGLRLRSPKTSRTLPKVVSRETMADLFAQLEAEATLDNPLGMQNLLMVELLYASGMRVSELVGLNLEDLDLDWENSITVVEWGAGMLDTIVDEWLELVIDRSHSSDDETRTVTIHAHGPRGNELADEIGRSWE